ncbi:MAG: pyridoxal-phosphate dependent enzyme [Flavobacteriaceae bacterium]
MKLYIKREDQLHPYISGNKFRKLKYNLLEAKKQGHSTLLTFGGAFSNHISAVSYAAKVYGFQSIGVVRGEELQNKISENPTLSFAQANGMQFEFVSREDYREKDSEVFIEKLHQKYGNFYLIPEGGTNDLAVKGCEEILTEQDDFFDYICCAVGTGGTISGIINSSKPHQKVLGFPALKGDFLESEIKKFTKKDNWKLVHDYHFGGYAKINEPLIAFINEFRKQTEIPLDPVYTGKMCYGVYDLIRKGYFEKEANILLIHTGGLQGIAGMNEKLKRQKLPLIHV